MFAAYAKFGPVVGCGDVVPSYQAVLSRFSGFSAVASFSKLQLRTYEAYGVPLWWAMKFRGRRCLAGPSGIIAFYIKLG